ncbi:MAG: nitroreductase family protein [Chlorobiaceae bacterium]|nr:nitroreductase family protein [Chlorobiaceae bacterium]NTV59836.1 nitroreductase family protein [Chlorobiaceae bacterium]
MFFRDLVTKGRNYVTYDGSAAVPEELLLDLLELACYVPSRGNLQPLKYLLVSATAETGALVSMLLPEGSFAGWAGVPEGERPRAFIVMFGDLCLGSEFATDSGIAAQTILLGAADAGYGGCIVTSFDREGLAGHFGIPGFYLPLLVIAIGKPSETVVIEQMSEDDPISCHTDANGIRRIPKRVVRDVLLRARCRE